MILIMYNDYVKAPDHLGQSLCRHATFIKHHINDTIFHFLALLVNCSPIRTPGHGKCLMTMKVVINMLACKIITAEVIPK